jgi:hypothetical protein
LVSGILLILVGAVIWGVGGLLNNSITILVGVLLFVGGILLFFGGITGILDKL